MGWYVVKCHQATDVGRVRQSAVIHCQAWSTVNLDADDKDCKRHTVSMPGECWQISVRSIVCYYPK